MEPTRHKLAFDHEPAGLLEALQESLEGQGSPPITAGREECLLVFESDQVWVGWRDHIAP